MSSIQIADGKYTIINDVDQGGDFCALRYGEHWRDLIGDKLMLAMYHEIESLRAELAKADRERRKWAGSTDFRR